MGSHSDYWHYSQTLLGKKNEFCVTVVLLPRCWDTNLYCWALAVNWTMSIHSGLIAFDSCWPRVTQTDGHLIAYAKSGSLFMFPKLYDTHLCQVVILF